MRTRGLPEWMVNAAAATAALAAVGVIAMQFSREGSRRRFGRRRPPPPPPTPLPPWEEDPYAMPMADGPPPAREPAPPPRTPPSSERPGAGDPLDDLLNSYERRKQDETRRMVERADRLERNRRIGAEVLREHAVDAVRAAAARLEQAGHRVVLQEMLQDYPPSIRLHVWPRGGPLDRGASERSTLEVIWGDPQRGRLCARWWDAGGMEGAVDHDWADPEDVDSLWVREQILEFLREVLR